MRGRPRKASPIVNAYGLSDGEATALAPESDISEAEPSVMVEETVLDDGGREVTPAESPAETPGNTVLLSVSLERAAFLERMAERELLRSARDQLRRDAAAGVVDRALFPEAMRLAALLGAMAEQGVTIERVMAEVTRG